MFMRRVFYIGGGILVFLVLAALCLPFLVDANRFKPRLEAELTKALGRKVTVGDLKLSLFAGGVSAD